MKKQVALFAFLLCIFMGVSWNTRADELKNISLDYCDTTGNVLQYTVEPEVQTGICYSLTNNSDQVVTMKVNFIDGTYTNDQRQNKACLDETAKTNFGQYVSKYSETVTLTWGETKMQSAKLLYPTWLDGQYYGCVTYSVISAVTSWSTWTNTNFTILMRKAKFIDVLVGHPENITWGVAFKPFTTPWAANISPNPKIRIYQDPADNKYVVELTVQNIWWAEEDVVITWVASNFLTYRNTFVEARKLLKWQEFVITKKLDVIPNYQLNVDIKLSHTPIIPGLPDVVPQTSYIQETASIFIINIITYITIAGLLILLIIIIFLIRSAVRRKKQQPTWTPVTVSPTPTVQPTPPVQTPPTA